jgi:lysyl-tRNA synthetase, class II
MCSLTGAKRRRRILVWAVTLVTLWSGLVNLLSVIGPGLPGRTAWLLRVFPLAFLHLSRFVILLAGLALVVSSVNLHRRKKRAFKVVFALACVSIIFHLLKGLDYEENRA